MKTSLSLAIGIMMGVGPALSAASAAPAASTAPASQPIRLFNKTMTDRAKAITPLRLAPEFQREVRERRREIEARLKAEHDAGNRILLALGWANWELAEAAAPAATRWMMGYRTQQDLDQFGQIANATNRALDSAKRDLDSLGKSKDTAVSRRRAQWRETLETLRLFADAYEALAAAASQAKVKPASVQDACREAALGLAELRENEDPDTAAAARLWQAALLEAGTRSRRDLEVLDLALAPPARLPYDFFARILRCQILMDRGSYAVAAALLLRMEGRCDRWFGDDKDVAARAKLTLTAVRINCLWQWADTLRVAEPAEAARQQEQADALAAKTFPPDKEIGVYRLARAIPVFVEVPPVKEEAVSKPVTPPQSASRTASAPTSKPASRPTSRHGRTRAGR